MDLIKRNKNFGFLFTGSLISSFGDYLYDIAITLLVYDLTKSIDSIAYMWVSKGALRIGILYLGGLITDKFNRKRIIVMINLISAPLALMFLFVDKNNLWIAFLGVFLLQSINDIDSCSENAILPELVDKDDLPKANTIFSFSNQILMLSSLAISGLIYKLAGAHVLFTVNALSFLLSSLVFQLIQYHPHVRGERNTVKILDTKVFKLFSGNQMLRLILFSSAMIAVVGRIYDVTNILVADTKLNISSAGIIYFRYALAAGGFLTPLIMRIKVGQKSFDSYILFSTILVLSILGFGLSNNLVLTISILILFGLTSTLQGVYFRSLLQENVSSGYLGRIFSFYRIVFTAISLATVTFIPFAIKLIGIEWLYLSAGAPIGIYFIYLAIDAKKSSTHMELL